MFKNLGDLIDDTRPSDTVALIDCSDDEAPKSYSYGQLRAKVAACARGLSKCGLNTGDTIAILSTNRMEFVVSYLAIMQAGMVAVPVNHKLAPLTIEFILEDCNASLVLVDAARRNSLGPGVRSICFDDSSWTELQDEGGFEPLAVDPAECAMILYTSGSTGRPKGVKLSHAGQLWTVRARFITRSTYATERFIVAAPLFHMNALTNCKFAFAGGACVVLMPQFEPLKFIDAIERHGVTWITSVPTMMAMILREHEALAKIDTSRIRFIRMGSAPATPQLYEAVGRAFPNATLAGGYGTTEAGPIVFGPRQGHPLPAPGALGWPLPDVEVRLVDPAGQDAEEGELWMRTPANLMGYLNLPEQTAKVLSADGWYRSGDIFRRDSSGCYAFVGRADDMFNCGGENIFPAEVERVIEKMPAVLEACVIPIADEIKGQKPIAFVVLRRGMTADEDEIKRFVLANAPAYQHPRRVFIMDCLPLAATNKVDRRFLAARAESQMTSTSTLNKGIQ